MMTTDEMKLAVCEKLPELIEEAYQKEIFMWKKTWTPINWPTEGLQVCHEAEKLLTKKQYAEYAFLLGTKFGGICSAYEQRLEALCRVWWPERFV